MASLAQFVTGARVELADHDTGSKSHAFGRHLLDAAINVRLFHLEIGNAVAQKAADAIILFEHRHVVPDARELLRGRQAGRPRCR